MASTYLSRTLGTPTNAYKGTLSYWQKAASTTATNYILACESGSERMLFYITQGLFQAGLRGTSAPPDIDFTISGTPKFRDPSAWYHVVLAWDSTQSTASDRMKLYVNNVQYTWSGSGTGGINDIPQNHVMPMNKSGLPFRIGSTIIGGSYFEGVMSHIHFIDGTAYDATAFGEYDANGVWKIKTSPTVTYGNNGFWWLKDTNTATDSSPNSNTPTIGGTLTKTEDSPSNVFATMNPLVPTSSLNFSNGNTTLTGTSATNYSSNNTSTLGATSGKYYFEIKYNTAGINVFQSVGISPLSISPTTNPTGAVTDLCIITMENVLYYEGNNTSSYLPSTPTAGDIIQIALDMDNGKVWFGLNGTFVGDPVAGTGSAFDGITSGETIGLNVRALDAVYKLNFGNGYFGTTAVASAGTNASGNGIFEYDVPTGYTALSTKGLNL